MPVLMHTFNHNLAMKKTTTTKTAHFIFQDKITQKQDGQVMKSK